MGIRSKLIRRDEKELRRLFTPLKSRATSKNSGRVNPAVISKVDRVLKVVPVQVFVTDESALLDTGDVSNIMSVELTTHLRLAPRHTQKTIKIADGSNYGCIGRLRNVPVTFGNITVHLEFLIVRNAPIGIVIGSPVLERMGAVRDLAGQLVDLSYEGKTARIGLEPVVRLPFQQGEDSEIVLLTKESSNAERGGEEDDPGENYDSEELYVVILAKRIRFSQPQTLQNHRMRKKILAEPPF